MTIMWKEIRLVVCETWFSSSQQCLRHRHAAWISRPLCDQCGRRFITEWHPIIVSAIATCCWYYILSNINKRRCVQSLFTFCKEFISILSRRKDKFQVKKKISSRFAMNEIIIIIIISKLFGCISLHILHWIVDIRIERGRANRNGWIGFFAKWVKPDRSYFLLTADQKKREKFNFKWFWFGFSDSVSPFSLPIQLRIPMILQWAKENSWALFGQHLYVFPLRSSTFYSTFFLRFDAPQFLCFGREKIFFFLNMTPTRVWI